MAGGRTNGHVIHYLLINLPIFITLGLAGYTLVSRNDIYYSALCLLIAGIVINNVLKYGSLMLVKICHVYELPIFGKIMRPIGTGPGPGPGPGPNSADLTQMFEIGIVKAVGMPSGHAQFMWLFLYLMYRILGVGEADIKMRQHNYNSLLMAIICLVVVTVSWSRIYYGYHTRGQVIAGAFVGLAIGYLAYP